MSGAEKAASVKKSMKVARLVKSPVAYVGPSKLSLGLKTNTIYQSKPVELIESLEDTYPSIGRLFVAVENLSKASEDVRRAGTPMHIAYEEILKEGK